jgi:hypothetical protein
MALLVLADQNTKTHARSPVAFFAKLMEADHFHLHSVLSVRWCCDDVAVPETPAAIATAVSNGLKIIGSPVQRRYLRSKTTGRNLNAI